MTLTKKIMGTIAAIALVIMVTTVTFAFKAAVKNSSKEQTSLRNDVGLWYFNGSNPIQENSYDRIQDEDYECGVESTTVCSVNVPENTTLEDYLDANKDDILAISIGRREASSN